MISCRFSKASNTLAKVLVDQGIGAPIFNVSYIVVTSKNKTALKDTLNNKLMPQLFLHWKFWPFFHSVNFFFIPLDYRVVAMNFGKIFWSGLLSYNIKGKESHVTCFPAPSTQLKEL